MAKFITKLLLRWCLPVVLWLTNSQIGNAAVGKVGLGVGVGAAYSPTRLQSQIHTPEELVPHVHAGQSFAWGFFVDVPVGKNFYVTPAAQVYQFNLGDGVVPLTDIELQIKFLAPISIVRVGLGGLLGATAANTSFGFHAGGGVYVNINVLSNLDLFVQAKYAKLLRPHGNLDVIQAYAGGMVLF